MSNNTNLLFNNIELDIDYLNDSPLSINFFTLGNGKKGLRLVNNYNTVLLYGRNGSGKSSIANLLYDESLVTEENLEEHSNTVSFHKNIKELEREEIDKSNLKIYSYSDKFINNEINYTNNEDLDAIIMLGDQGEIQHKIDKLEKELFKRNTNKENITQKYNKKIDKRDEKFNKMVSLLRAEKSWADNDRLIKGNRQNTAVTGTRITEFYNLTKNIPEENIIKKLAEFRKIYDDEIDKLNIIRDKTELPNMKELTLLNKELHNDIINILSTELTPPSFTDRENLIIETISKKGRNMLNTIEKEIKYDYCPTCFREINEQLRRSLINSIDNVKQDIDNNEVKKFEEKIRTIILPEQPDVPEEYNKLIDTENYIKHHSKYNKVKSEIEDILKNKLNQPYKKIPCPEIKILESEFKNLKIAYEKIRIEVSKYNSVFEQEKEIKRSAIEANNLIYSLEIRELNNEFEAIKQKIIELEGQDQALTTDIKNIKDDILELSSELKQTKIALDDMNNHLRFIFFEENRLKLEPVDKGYAVYSQGSKVKLNDLSEGEKTIINLCYFFSTINKNKLKRDFYKDEILVVLDDPITSVDLSNQIGIYSFLRMQFNNMLEGNSASKYLILVHDLGIYENIDKIFDDIGNKRIHKILKNGQVEKNKIEVISSGYTRDLQELYDFAKNEEPDDLPAHRGIGNLLRRVLESYSTFFYKTGITQLSTNSDFYKDFLEEDEAEYFQNSMYRLIAHGGSHSESSAKNHGESTSYEINLKETWKLVRIMFYYLHKLNPHHIIRHLENDNVKEVETNFNEWKNKYIIINEDQYAKK